MSIPTEEFVKRLDKVTKLHEKSLSQLAELYEMYQNLQKKEEEMKQIQPIGNEEVDKKAKKLLGKVQETKVEMEYQLKDSMRHVQDVGDLKAFVEQMVAIKAEQDMSGRPW